MVFVSAVIALCIVLVLGVAAYDRRASIKAYWEHRRTIRIQRGLVMGRKNKAKREAYLKGLWGEAITEFGEEAFFAGKMTREEVNSFYRAIGKTHGMPDLLPYLTPEQVKSAIKGRRARGIPSPAQEKPAWGDDPPAATASTTPADGNVINAAKRFGAKALAKLKKTA
jgi:hypothetical protein